MILIGNKMSDSIKKWQEMQEDKLDDCCGADCGCHDDNMSATTVGYDRHGKFIYESPDGGKTVTARPFGGDIEDRVVIKEPTADEIADTLAEELVNKYDDSIIKLAFKKIMNH